MNRFDELDGLRGMAALGIVVFHAHYGPWFYWMWTFVDLFFVLSGFLITRIILKSIDGGSFALKSFYMRRVLRIWPVYYAVMLLCIALIFVTGTWGNEYSGVWTAPFFLQHTHHYLAPSFNAGAEQFLPYFAHSWSIAIEEQFYLVLPIVLMAFGRKNLYFLPFVLFFIVLAVMFRASGAFQWLLISRMDALCIGILIAFYWFYCEEKEQFSFRISRIHVSVLLSIGLLLIFSDSWPLELKLPKGAAYSLLGFNFVFGCTIVVLLKKWLTPIGRFFSSSAMVYLGSISYALYMIHVPVRGVLLGLFANDGERLISDVGFGVQVAYFCLALGGAHMSKILLERPMDRFKSSFPI